MEKRNAKGVAMRNAEERLIVLGTTFTKPMRAMIIENAKARGTRTNAPSQPAIKKARMMTAIFPSSKLAGL